MKPPTADNLPASILLFLSISSNIANTIALTIPPTSSIQQVNASGLLSIILPSLNATSLDVGHFDPHCAPSDDDEEWYNEAALDKWRYDTTCYEAMRLFAKEQSRHEEQEFEFLAPGAQPTTHLKSMQTPRRYSYGGSDSHWNPSCTIIVAMLDFASPGELPDQPAGSFKPSDVTSFEDLVDAGGEVFMQCIRARGVGILPDLHFGWVRAGQGGNMAVLLTGTKSQIDRSIPRGVHP